MRRAMHCTSCLLALAGSLGIGPALAAAQAPPPPPRDGVEEPPQRPARGLDRPRQRGDGPRRDPRNENAAPVLEPGVKKRTEAAQPGYTLYAPISSTDTYLVDLDGNRVHTWPSNHTPGHSVYLLEDGSILRTCRERESEGFSGGGQGGRIQKIAWDGSVKWDYLLASEAHLQHHDIELMPNGNILAIVWERLSAEEARALGVPDTRLGSGEFWPDAVYEIKPDGARGGEIVWRWRAIDHTVQDIDPNKPNFGKPSEHPGRMDLGYGNGRRGSDWLHTNAIAYNPELDQIALSIHGTSELWIIDHSNTTEQAAGPAGDLLYRWGNPAAYGMGSADDQALHVQHDVHWIRPGLPGAGDLLVFDNQAGGQRGPRGKPGLGNRAPSPNSYSAVLQITAPLTPDGNYARDDGAPFGPKKATWRVDGKNAPTRFYSQNISGAQRLPNGNTLICSGAESRFIEVTPDGTTCWEFVPPASAIKGGPRAPDGPFGDGPPPGRPPGLQGDPGGAPAPPPGRGGRGRPGGGGNNIFRCERILPSHPALQARQDQLSTTPLVQDDPHPDRP